MLDSSREKLKRMVVWDWNQTWDENEVSWNVGLEWDWPARNLRPLQGWSVVAPSSENAADSLFPYMASQHRGRGLRPHILQSDWGCLGGRMPSSSNSRPAVRRCCLYQTSLHGCKMTYIGLMQAPFFQASSGRAVSQQRFTKTQIWVTVMTGFGPSFKVGVSFWAISLCLFLIWVLVAD